MGAVRPIFDNTEVCDGGRGKAGQFLTVKRSVMGAGDRQASFLWYRGL